MTLQREDIRVKNGAVFQILIFRSLQTSCVSGLQYGCVAHFCRLSKNIYSWRKQKKKIIQEKQSVFTVFLGQTKELLLGLQQQQQQQQQLGQRILKGSSFLPA
jgi:hypothetical protein